jgi:hypothetical protein
LSSKTTIKLNYGGGSPMKPIAVSCLRSSTPATQNRNPDPAQVRRRQEMTRVARMTPTIRRGTAMGERVGGPPLNEAEHFWKCEACGGWFEMRDLGAVCDNEEPLASGL